MRYLTLHEALHVHAMLLKAYGGAPGIRDRGLIEAALLRPQTGYYSDLVEEAAALWESLAMNHGFVDGNKRVGFACMEIFLDLNGLELTAGEDETIRFIYERLESGTFTKDTLDVWLRANTASI
ncbi:type II toxin-antitoxin system death-on-curing family toxin [Hoeflea sp.]|uniref:type II toxin-antitoxin system death-on-curing family toxin n=1 Tax=Hoeflea sp. TaxID=1940281 RepID=UPI003A924DF4